jgi:histidinol-phosphate aminotransferase
MSLYWNERTKNIVPYIPGEQPKDRQFIKLNTNENPYPPSPKVIEALTKAANESLRLYPDPNCTGLRETIAARYGVKPGQVFASNGSDEVLAFAFAAFFPYGTLEKPLLFPDITYSFYPVYANLWNVPYRTIPLKDDFTVNCEDYKIPCGGAVFPNPNAPTGIKIQLDDILSLAEYLERRNSVLIVDEAYAAFGAQSATPHIEKHRNILTVHTLSKSASLAGLRAGFAVGSEELIEGLCRIRDSFNSYTMDRLALAGATAAIEDYAYYERINQKVVETRERTANELRSMNFNVLPSSANFLFVKDQILSGEKFFSGLREKGILVRYFKKERIEDYLRVSIGTDGEMDRFLDACRDIKERK